jgi:hypothetical protein
MDRGVCLSHATACGASESLSVLDAKARVARRSARGDSNQPPQKKAAHKFMPDNDFKALAALSRNFFRADFSNPSSINPTRKDCGWSSGRQDFAPEAQRSRKRNGIFAGRNGGFRAPTGNPLKSLGRKDDTFRNEKRFVSHCRS